MATEAALFRDLAVVLLAAGAMALVFYYLKQPVVLGYLLAGFFVGPFSPGPSFTTGEVLPFLGELGIVFLLFALGLEFNLSKLRKVGATAIIAGTLEIAIMLALGYGIGQLFGWTPLQSVFLGAVMSISSTTVIVKVLAERGQKDEEWAQLAFGILIIEDVLAVLILTALSGAAATGNFQPELLGGLALKLGIFLGAALLLGLLAAPRIVDRLAALKVEEVGVVLTVGIGFGLALLAAILGFSPGLGAFVAGALMAESPRVAKIAHKVEPLRDVFTAIFFVTVGAALDPSAVLANWRPILVVSAGVIAGKVFGVTLATFVTGQKPTTSLRVGMTLAQIGEFAFIIAALGASLAVVPSSLYAVAIAVSALTTFLTPYLISASPKVVGSLGRRVPAGFHAYATTYGAWVGRLHRTDREDPEWRTVRLGALSAALTSAVVVAIFALGAPFTRDLDSAIWSSVPFLSGILSFGTLLLIAAATPFVLLFYQSVKRLVNALARLAVPQRLRAAGCTPTERILRRTFGLGATVITAALLVVLGSFFLGSVRVLFAAALLGIAVSSGFLGRSLGRFNAEVERTLERVMSGDAGRADAMAVIENARAWGAASREVMLPTVSGAGGRTIGTLRLRELTGASVVSVRRNELTTMSPGPAHRFAAGDQVLLMGEDEALTRAEEILLGRDLGVAGGATEIVVGARFAGASIEHIALGSSIQLLLVRRDGQPMTADRDLILEAGDVLVVAGPDDEVDRLVAQGG